MTKSKLQGVRLMAVLYIELLPEAKFYSKERVLKEISEELNKRIYFIPLAQKLIGVEIKERK